MTATDDTKRPWGHYVVFADDPHTKVKRLVVIPGGILSYQSHKKRGEHWIVVKGVASVTINDRTKKYKYGEYINIPRGAKHRLANHGKEIVEVIEVQVGTYFGEDDIVRYSDVYGRAGDTERPSGKRSSSRRPGAASGKKSRTRSK
jgi:mannose-6-phosphate isomerase-like protein (cupin superfamily)